MPLESVHQSKITKFLKSKGFFVIKLVVTNIPGIPDLLAIKDGRVLFVEVKNEVGRVSMLQLFVHKQLKKVGCPVIIPYGYEDFLTKYEQYVKN